MTLKNSAGIAFGPALPLGLSCLISFSTLSGVKNTGGIASVVLSGSLDWSITPLSIVTRSSADADNGLDAFVGQSRSTNISGPFQVK